MNIAPPGSPLVSPAGFGPSVPGTPVPQGVLPGANLLPASPTPLASLAHLAPALLPHAPAGNGLPDNVVTALPAYEPRLGGAALGVPEASGATAHQAATHHQLAPRLIARQVRRVLARRAGLIVFVLLVH